MTELHAEGCSKLNRSGSTSPPINNSRVKEEEEEGEKWPKKN